MALRGIEGWDGFADGLTGASWANIIVDKWIYTLWPSSTGVETKDERYTDEKTWDAKSSGEAGLGISFSDNPEEIICGVYILNGLGANSNRSNTSASWYKIIGVRAGSNFHIQISQNGLDLFVQLINNTTATATIANILEPRRWNLIELKAKVHDTTGYWYLYVNGVEVGSATGLDTKYSTSDVTGIVFYTYGIYANVGDFYCNDLTGSKNNDVLGPFHIQGILPNANGDDSDWTPSANADNYTMVDEETANESDYIESGTANQQDLYNYENLIGTWDTIFGIQINSRLFLDTAGSETVAVVCSSNGTEDSANFTVDNDSMGTGDEIAVMRILEDDPDTSDTWASANVDAAQFGVKFI